MEGAREYFPQLSSVSEGFWGLPFSRGIGNREFATVVRGKRVDAFWTVILMQILLAPKLKPKAPKP